jgi:hypothetical protein
MTHTVLPLLEQPVKSETTNAAIIGNVRYFIKHG